MRWKEITRCVSLYMQTHRPRGIYRWLVKFHMILLVQQVPQFVSVRTNAFYRLYWRNEDEVSGKKRTASRSMGKRKKQLTSPTICEKGRAGENYRDEANREVFPLQTDDCLTKTAFCTSRFSKWEPILVRRFQTVFKGDSVSRTE